MADEKYKISSTIHEINIPGIRKLIKGEIIPDNILEKLKADKLFDDLLKEKTIEKIVDSKTTGPSSSSKGEKDK